MWRVAQNEIAYDKLMLATGSRPLSCPFPELILMGFYHQQPAQGY